MKKKVFSLLLAGMLTFSMGTTAYATEDAIADMQAQKQQAEAGLAQTQANIDSLQSKKQELENYLSDLNTQYEDLTNAISELSIQAGEKENELKQLHTELKKAKKALNKQYDDMKLRIQYMYENGGTSALETLLSSKDLSEFLNNAESVARFPSMTGLCWTNARIFRTLSKIRKQLLRKRRLLLISFLKRERPNSRRFRILQQAQVITYLLM